jgi:protocatechuate 3,4-dioxygenase beta subunit
MHPTPPDPRSAHLLPRPSTRRRFLHAAAGGAGMVALAPLAAADAALRITPANALGPFYPPQKPADSDADLTRVDGRPQRATGTILYVFGRVVDSKGRPQAGAELELWQANAFGRYAHPADSDASGPLDPNFQGYGRLRADADGRYRITTIKPAPYGGRTAHLHFNVASGSTRLTTQMFFEGELANERDGLYRYLDRDDRRASTGHYVDRAPGMEAAALATAWDIVLRA